MKTIFYLFIFLYTPHLLLGQIVIEWEKNYGGNDAEYFTSVALTNDGGFMLGGTSKSSDGDVGGNKGDRDFWVVKTDAWGTIEWEKNYGGSNSDWLSSLVQTTDGGFILGGHSSSIDGDVGDDNLTGVNLDFWIVKIDSLGNIAWQQDYGETATEQLFGLQATSDGGYISGGMNRVFFGQEAIEENYGCWDFWVVKTDALGTIEWQKNYGGTQCDGLEDLQETSDGGFILGGGVGSSDKDVGEHNGLLDYWLVKIDAFGNIEWEQTYAYGSEHEESINTLTQTNDGGFIFGGYTAPLISPNGEINEDDKDIWLVKTDALGSVEWEKSYGGSMYDELFDIQQLNDGGYMLGARTTSADGAINANYGGQDYWILKIDSIGNIEWEKNYGGTSLDLFAALEVINQGSFLIGGTTNSTDIDVSTHYGSGDFWIAKIVDTTIVTLDTMQVETDTTATAIKEIQPLETAFTLYPNPNNGQFTIASQNNAPFTLIIQNNIGQTILEKEVTENFAPFNLSNQATGVYIVSIQTEKSFFVKKILLIP